MTTPVAAVSPGLTITLPFGTIFSLGGTHAAGATISVISKPADGEVFAARSEQFAAKPQESMEAFIRALVVVMGDSHALESEGVLFNLPSGFMVRAWPDSIFFCDPNGDEENSWFRFEWEEAPERVLSSFLLRLAEEFPSNLKEFAPNGV